MKLIDKIKNLFTYTPIIKPEVVKTVKDLDLFDGVWVEDDGELYEGWIFDITRRCIVVVYGKTLLDYRFQIPRPINVDKIVQGNKTLYCNNPSKT